MWRFRRSARSDSGLESRLREARSEPRTAFVTELSERLAEPKPRPVRAWSRVAFAGAVTTLMLGTFASFGGLGYAASGAASTYHAAKQIVAHKAVTVHSSAAAQYPPKPKPPPSPPNAGTAGAVAVQNAAAGVAGQNAGVAAAGTLPFTGYSLLGTAVVGFGLVGTGLVLRRRERRDS